jgi:hypothetical protein
LEIRDHEKKQVSFSAIDYVSNQFLWKDFHLEEKWWVSLGAATADKIIFTCYLETQNPDKKGILVYHLQPPALVWWSNDFSLTAVSSSAVHGYTSKFGNREVKLDVQSGSELSPDQIQQATSDIVCRPVQYAEGSSHFDTVKTFLAQKLNLSPVLAFEYLEYDSRIFISYYVMETGLANYLLVVGSEGEVLLHEKLDEHLKGIGMDTFFVLAGCLFFVKNREDLVSYFL